MVQPHVSFLHTFLIKFGKWLLGKWYLDEWTPPPIVYLCSALDN